MKELRELTANIKHKHYGKDGTIIEDQSNYLLVTIDSDGFLHSFDNKPARKLFKDIIDIYWNDYFKNGKYHNLNGTADNIYSNNDILLSFSYWIEGVHLTKEQWQIESNRINMLNEI